MVVRMLTAAAGYHDDSYHDNSVEMMKDVITLFTVSYTHTHSHTLSVIGVVVTGRGVAEN